MTAKFNLMSDSTCDLSAEDAKRLGITLVSFTYTEAGDSDDRFHGVDDQFQSRSAHEFYEAIRNGATPMTSQPSQLVYEEALRKALATGLPTVLFCISSALSGSHNGAMTVVDRLREEVGQDCVPIYVIDSKSACTAQYVIVEEAARMRDAGATAEEVVAWAQDAPYRIHTLCMLDGLDTLQRGGRIPKSVAKIAGALDTKPFIGFAVDGSLKMCGVTHGRTKGKKKLAKCYADQHTESMVVIGDADCPDEAAKVADLIRVTSPDVRVLRCSIGPTIGCHLGPGALVCSFWGGDRRQK